MHALINQTFGILARWARVVMSSVVWSSFSGCDHIFVDVSSFFLGES